MDDFTYRLVVLTHGPDVTLSRTLRSFLDHVRPHPTEWACHADGIEGWKSAQLWGREVREWDHWSHSFRNLGFCDASRSAWDLARRPGVDWIFWLEHDFLFTRRVNLEALSLVLELTERVKQMALLRQPMGEEIPHGGFLKQHEGAYIYHKGWIETQRNWTTNPALFSRDFTLQYDWPASSQQCEGLFGFDIKKREPTASFGIWGEGELWVEHIGTRTGHGY